MFEQTIAVVDLETTAPNHKEGRIIQIGIALIQKEEIVSVFSTDVNPGREIPKRIEKLTGVMTEQVKRAPFFEEVAETIVSLLENTVFVAHNIHFDYSFLNAELERIGFPKLNHICLDTVELAQIFLPTSPSFRLQDLAKQFHFTHEQPHQAGSDAKVTAQLFLKIKEVIAQIPDITLQKLAFLSPTLSVDNDLFIRNEWLQRKQSVAVREDQVVIQGIVLRKQEVSEFQGEKFSYPETQKEKECCFQFSKGRVTFFEQQARYSDEVYRYFHEEEEETCDLLLEADSGARKTFGYLFPLSFLATREKPAIVSTSSIFLQHQLLREVQERVNVVAPIPFQATIVKADSHYLNVSAFAKVVEKAGTGRQFVGYQMSLLVWLLETTTGDLDELPQKNEQHSFFEQVRHWGVEWLNPADPFYAVDFLRLQRKRLCASNLLIVNHAFLAWESFRETRILPASDWLLVDEATRLPEILLKTTRTFVDPERLLQKGEELLNEDDSPLKRYSVPLVKEVYREISLLVSELIRSLGIKEEGIEEKEERYPFEKFVPSGRKLAIHQRDLAQILEKFVCSFREQAGLLELSLRKRIQRNLSDVLRELGKLVSLMTEEGAALSRSVFWKKTRSTPLLVQLDFTAGKSVVEDWGKRYQKRLYTAGKFVFEQKERKEFLARLQLPPASRVCQIAATTEGAIANVRAYFPQEILAGEPGIEAIALFLKQLARTVSKRMLVLFSDLEYLKKVAGQFQREMVDEAQEVFIQTFYGKTEKMIHQFLLSEDAILFGAEPFWKSADALKNAVELLVVVQLPFEKLSDCWVEDFVMYQSSQGKNAFKEVFLPEVRSDLQRMFSWMTRAEAQKGAVIFFDSRIQNQIDSRRLCGALPSSVEIQVKSSEEILSQVLKFLVE